MFEKVGGATAVRTAVTVFYERVLKDDTLSAWFEGVDLDRLAMHQRAFITAALGGPAQYGGRSLRVAHAGLGVTDAAFDALAEHLAVTLLALGASLDVVEEVRSRLNALRGEIVEAPTQTGPDPQPS
ncbi:group I truncated hemoglobin [Luethyella okanaganae]|uniref:Group 1 truncated hemoglobin n=1 Tax=Luethyella okanaganae TaxID=69372 RepID=A0ABW1VG67_9MICO